MNLKKKSPSMRREWIEMADSIKPPESRESPSMRREWIERSLISIKDGRVYGLPPCGGSGLKLPGYALPVVPMGLPPCGGSGLKCAWEGIRCIY